MLKKSMLMFGIAAFAITKLNAQVKDIFPTQKYSTTVPEPSDVAFDPTTEHLFLVSDNGYLFECDREGKIIKKAAFQGMDFEGVAIDNDYVYVMDESLRKVHRFIKSTLEQDYTWEVPYAGARNKGFESLSWNPDKNCYIAITEKSPILIKEYSSTFTNLGQYTFKQANDISAARYHNGFMYLLSDEDRMIFKCDPKNYKVLAQYHINILNPEGIDFDKDGHLIIVSDDLHTIYYYNQTIID